MHVARRHAKPVHDPLRGMATFRHRGDHQIRTEYRITGSQEANPMEHKLSDDSPFGRGLYGHVAGATIEVEAPIGTLKYTIVSVENN